jgi:hypothetical protein
VGLIEREGLESSSSAFAMEGTAAHELAARALLKDLDPDAWLDAAIEVEKNEYITVTDEMVEAVTVYVHYVREAAANAAGKLWIEKRFDLASMNPPAPMYGTTDAAIFTPRTKPTKRNVNGQMQMVMGKPSLLEIVDYKHGRGVVVEALDNPQLLYYALGAIMATKVRPDRVKVTVVQPRAPHTDGIIRSAEYEYEEIVEFKNQLFEDARATQDPGASLCMGDWCRFCPAQAICPEQQDLFVQTMADPFTHSQLVAVEEFGAELPVPEGLSREVILEVMEKAPMIEAWFKSIREHVRELTEAGEETGYKLVPKRAMRRWRDTDEVEAFLQNQIGEEAFARKLRSPAQAEKALKAIGMKLPEQLWVKISSGSNLVPESDPRPALPPEPQDAAADFAGFDVEPESS